MAAMFQIENEVVSNQIKELLTKTKETLGNKLVGLYLTGSSVLGDFDEKISDLDFVAAVSEDLNDQEFEALKKMHQEFANKYPEWNDRIDVCYVPTNDLKKAKTGMGKLAKISAGEPLNRRELNKERIVLWYLTREQSLTLFGPDPKTIIEAISKEEFIEAVKIHAKGWVEYVKDTENSRPSQAYAILTLCRALYAINNTEQVSKKKAASWVIEKYPEWSNLINEALKWRENYRDEENNGEETYPETVKFVNFAISEIN